MPDGSPVYQRVSEDGTVTAEFDATIHAKGLTLDTSEVITEPPTETRIKWQRQSDGAYTADIRSVSANNANGSALDLLATTAFESSPGNKGYSGIKATTSDLVNAVGWAVRAFTQPNDGIHPTQSVTLIDGAGRSNFLQLADGTSARKITFNSGRTTMPASGATPSLFSFDINQPLLFFTGTLWPVVTWTGWQFAGATITAAGDVGVLGAFTTSAQAVDWSYVAIY